MGDKRRRIEAGSLKEVFERKYTKPDGTTLSASAMGICWYPEEEYAELARLMPDDII